MTDKPLTKVIKKIISHKRGCLTCRSPDCPVWQAAEQNCWKSQSDHDAQVSKKERERVIKHLEEFTWLRYSENRICEKGIDEHCEIRSEIKRMECNGGEP